MGKRELSGRENWQEQGGAKASKAEKNLYVAFYEHFHGTEYILHEKPKHLKNLYAGVTLPDEVISQIFNPSIDLEKIQWGVSPVLKSNPIIEGTVMYHTTVHQFKRWERT